MAAAIVGVEDLKKGLQNDGGLGSYLVSEVLMYCGRLCSPVHGHVPVTIARLPRLAKDPAEDLQMLRSHQCTIAGRLLALLGLNV